MRTQKYITYREALELCINDNINFYSQTRYHARWYELSNCHEINKWLHHGTFRKLVKNKIVPEFRPYTIDRIKAKHELKKL